MVVPRVKYPAISGFKQMLCLLCQYSRWISEGVRISSRAYKKANTRYKKLVCFTLSNTRYPRRIILGKKVNSKEKRKSSFPPSSSHGCSSASPPSKAGRQGAKRQLGRMRLLWKHGTGGPSIVSSCERLAAEADGRILLGTGTNRTNWCWLGVCVRE